MSAARLSAPGPGAYAELHCHSNFSFLDGAAHPEELAAVAADRGLKAMAVTDHDGLYAMVRFDRACRRVGVKPLLGAELTVEAITDVATPDPELLVDPLATSGVKDLERGRHHLTLLVRDRAGFSNLCRLLSWAKLADERIVTQSVRGPGNDRAGQELRTGVHRKGYSAASWELLAEHAGGLIALSGCKRFGLVPRLLRVGRRAEAARLAARLRELFGPDGFYLELQSHLLPDDPWLCAALAELGRDLGIPCVVTNDVHLLGPADKPVQDVLVAIRERASLDEMEARGYLAPNAERRVKNRAEMEEALLGPGGQDTVIALEPWLKESYLAALDRTVEIAGRCAFELDFSGSRFPGFPVPAGETPFSYLYQLCQEGARRKYRPMTAAVSRRLQTELEVIEKTGLAEFFLINWDLMKFAKGEGIPGQGRGSAADSIVAYLLDITRVDPVEHNLLFERFLHEEQKSTPDIDIDFASSRREEVIQYIYDKYGREKTGMVANVVTFRPRLAIREVGKAMGFSPATVDRLAKSADSWYPEEALEAARDAMT